MSKQSWKEILVSDLIDWLLEEENPSFPWMWDTDVLEMLLILPRLGYRDNRMQEALDLIVSKQDAKGRWILENTTNGRFQVNIERKGKQSKWITLNALRVLKHVENMLNTG